MKRSILIAIAAVSFASFASSAWAQGPPPGRGQPRADAAPLQPDEVSEHLTARLEQLEALQDHIVKILQRINAGEPPEEALGPIGVGMMQRRLREAPGPGPGGPGLWGLLPDNQLQGGPPADIPIEDVRAFIDEHLPELAARLTEAEQDNPRRAERMIRRIRPRLAGILREEGRDPELVRLRVEEMRAGMEILGKARALRRLTNSDAPASDIESAKQELRELLGRQIDLRNQLESHRIARMEADIETAKASLAEQVSRRDEIINEHLSRVLDHNFRGPQHRRGPGTAPGFGRGPGARERDKD